MARNSPAPLVHRPPFVVSGYPGVLFLAWLWFLPRSLAPQRSYGSWSSSAGPTSITSLSLNATSSALQASSHWPKTASPRAISRTPPRDAVGQCGSQPLPLT